MEKLRIVGLIPLRSDLFHLLPIASQTSMRFPHCFNHVRRVLESYSNLVPIVLCIRTHARNMQACNDETPNARTVAYFWVLCIMLCLHQQGLWKRVATKRRMHACCLHAARSNQCITSDRESGVCEKNGHRGGGCNEAWRRPLSQV